MTALARGHVPQLCASPLAEMNDRRLAGAELACDRAACRFHVPTDEAHHCALLWAERGGLTVREVAGLFGRTREWLRQLRAGVATRRQPELLALADGWQHARGFPEGETDGAGAESL